jgi:pimeloyl-ACP methyl ester carboxylesterase
MRTWAGLAGVVLTLVCAQPAAALEWGECPPANGLDPRQECATLAVPLDYRDPGGRQIEIAVSRIPATSSETRRGVLVMNPGGPGNPGLNTPSRIAALAPAELLEPYDLIGFDPRGVGRSSGVSCGFVPAPDEVVRLLPWPAPDGDIAANVAYSRGMAEACGRTSGDVLPFVTTANTARDIDRIRAGLGERRISYLGYSYGTYLGPVYATLFPRRAERLVLDSSIHPGRIWRETFRAWGPATEIRFPDFARWAAERHATYGLGDTAAEVRELYFELAARLDEQPIDLGNIVLTGNVFRTEMRADLYDDLLFPNLAFLMQFVNEFEAGTATAQARSALLDDPPVDNPFASLWAVACDDADWPEDPAVYARDVARDIVRYPLAGGMAANIWPCAFWPNEPREAPVEIDVEGDTKVLVVQSLRDPATPYEGGLAMRLELGDRARLVSVGNGGHIAAYDDDRQPCADDAVTSFLLTGRLPERDRFCPAAPVETGAARARAPAVPGL